MACGGGPTSLTADPASALPPAVATPVPAAVEWPLPDSCADVLWIRPLTTATAAALLPRCDVPAGSVRDWMQLEAFARVEYPNGPPADGAVERLCGDGAYAQAFLSDAGTFVLKGRLQDGRPEGEFELGFEGEDGQLEARWEAGVPSGAWRWDTTTDTVGFPVCATQSGAYAWGARDGLWHFEKYGDMGSAKYDLTFAAGVIEGPVSATVGWMGNRGAWVGAARAGERDGTWTFTGEADLEGTTIVEEWEAGRLVRRVVEPGPCVRPPGGAELCAAP